MSKQLFSISTNAKTVKGEKLGYLTGVMYLAPSDLSGYEVCPMAKKANCIDACLNKAGRGGMFTSVQTARINKTKRFFRGPRCIHGRRCLVNPQAYPDGSCSKHGSAR